MPVTIQLPAELVIDQARQIAEHWKARLASDDGTIIVEASALETADTAGIQLLLSLEKEARQSGRALELRAPSARLMMMLSAFGTASRFTIRDGGTGHE